MVRMAKRLWCDAHRYAVSADNGTVDGNDRDAEFLDKDHYGRDYNHYGLRQVASTNSQFQQYGIDDSRHLLQLKQVQRVCVEDFQSECL